MIWWNNQEPSLAVEVGDYEESLDSQMSSNLKYWN
jgi:hypothetical protein